MFIVIFLFTLLLSYSSAIAPGIINIKVIETSMYKSFKGAMYISFGAAITEMIYSFLAVVAGEALDKYPDVKMYIQIFMILLFLILMISNYIQSKKGNQFDTSKIAEKQLESKSPRRYILMGLGFGIINPQMFPYWFTTLMVIKGYEFTNGVAGFTISFVAGAMAGGWLLLFTYAYLASKYRLKLIHFFSKYNFNLFTSVLFLVLLILQIFKVYTNYYY